MVVPRSVVLGTGALILAAATGAVLWGQWNNRLVRVAPASHGSDDIARGEPPSDAPKLEFTFARLMYSGGSWGYKYWGTDYPQADRHLMAYARRLTNIRISAKEHPIRIKSPEIFRYPFVYAVEPEQMELSEQEAQTLRLYLLRGGFLVVDDFWGSEQWASFERQIRKVFPDRPIIDLPVDHELFHCFYDIAEITQVPAFGRYYSGVTYEEDGYFARCRGIVDDDGRLMVVINWNTDLGDGWEWANHPDYPPQYSAPAIKLGINMIVYALSH